MATLDTKKINPNDLRCPVCSAVVLTVEVNESPAHWLERSDFQVIMKCSNGCFVRTKGEGSKILIRRLTSWEAMRKILRLKK